jgi:hypothetical protein
MSQPEVWYNFTFWQNNSGGYFIGPSEFTVTAKTEKDAFAILKSQPWYSENHCECCGVRWFDLAHSQERI